MSFEKLEKKIDLLEKKINFLEYKLDKIINILENNKTNCEKMGNHIDFVENIYENVKNPLGYVCKKVSYLTGSDATDHKYLEK